MYFVGGFGVMGWVTAGGLQSRQRPIHWRMPRLRSSSTVNQDHADSLLLLARFFAGVEAEQATMTSVDRLGFHVRLKTADRVRGVRISFLVQAHSVADTRKIMEQMVKLAREGV